jgi:hypothetical protein
MKRMETSTPTLFWALLAGGFLLFGTLIAVLIANSGKDEGTKEPPIEAARPPTPPPEGGPEGLDPITGLPPYPPIDPELDGRPPVVIDGAEPGWDARLAKGPWLLVFASPGSEAGDVTLRAAYNLHRRLRGSGVNVAAVIPRSVVAESGALPWGGELTATLANVRLKDGMTVLLDPDAAGQAAIRGTKYALGSDVGVVVLKDGRMNTLSVPPEGGMPLHRMLPIARRALTLR